MSDSRYRSQIGKRWSMVKGLAFGAGFMDNISDAYRFLMHHYEPGDQVYLFGFSRGAFTARAVAALVHAAGLLDPGTENLLPYAIGYWLRAKTKDGVKLCAEFKATLARECKPRFIGVWDTVGSVGFINYFRTFPFTQHNPSVATVRHAVSLDERRAGFRHNLMDKVSENHTQDIRNVWFPGVHSDVGGGYPIGESRLAMVAFEWIVREAVRAGLMIDEIAYAREQAGCPADPTGRSLKGACWLVEGLPRRIYSYRDQRRHWRFDPNKPRYVREGSTLHASVLERLAKVNEYAPVNLGTRDAAELTKRFLIET